MNENLNEREVLEIQTKIKIENSGREREENVRKKSILPFCKDK